MSSIYTYDTVYYHQLVLHFTHQRRPEMRQYVTNFNHQRSIHHCNLRPAHKIQSDAYTNMGSTYRMHFYTKLRVVSLMVTKSNYS